MRVMTIAERNRKIKQVLSQVFGRKNVRVVGERGTGYGWVNITIYVKKPKFKIFRDKWGGYTYEASEYIHKIENKVWKVLKNAHLTQELGSYYDDMGYKHTEMLIDVKFKDK